MAFTLFHTVTVDGTSGTTEYADALAALDYFHGTFLPSCANTGTSTDGGSKRGFRLPAYDLRNANAPWEMKNWYTRPADGGSSNISLTVYEDGQWTSTPGDLLSTSANNKVFTWHDGSSLDYKFWKSDVNTDSWLITRGSQIVMAWYAPHVAVDKPTVAASIPSTSSQREVHVFPVEPASWSFCNWPLYANTSSSEGTLYCSLPAQNMQPEGAAFTRKFPILFGSANAAPAGYVDKADIQHWIPDNSDRQNQDSWAGSSWVIVQSSTLLKVLVDGTDWWLFSQSPTHGYGSISFYCGSTEPDLA